MENLDAEGGQHISDQAAVTAPPEKLCAHEDRAQPVSEHQNFIEPLGELFGGDVIGIGAERRMPPRQVGRHRARSPAPAKFRNPAIEHAVSREVLGKCVSGELRETARARKTSNVSNKLDSLKRQRAAKVVAGARGVANRPNRETHI